MRLKQYLKEKKQLYIEVKGKDIPIEILRTEDSPYGILYWVVLMKNIAGYKQGHTMRVSGNQIKGIGKKRIREHLQEKKLSFEILKRNKIKLDPEEREKAIKSGCVWHRGPNGEKQCAIWKSKDSSGNVKYICNTHRAYQAKNTLDGAIKAFDFIKTTA